jgi:hypothetical protein
MLFWYLWQFSMQISTGSSRVGACSLLKIAASSHLEKNSDLLGLDLGASLGSSFSFVFGIFVAIVFFTVLFRVVFLILLISILFAFFLVLVVVFLVLFLLFDFLGRLFSLLIHKRGCFRGPGVLVRLVLKWLLVGLLGALEKFGQDLSVHFPFLLVERIWWLLFLLIISLTECLPRLVLRVPRASLSILLLNKGRRGFTVLCSVLCPSVASSARGK